MSITITSPHVIIILVSDPDYCLMLTNPHGVRIAHICPTPAIHPVLHSKSDRCVQCTCMYCTTVSIASHLFLPGFRDGAGGEFSGKLLIWYVDLNPLHRWEGVNVQYILCINCSWLERWWGILQLSCYQRLTCTYVCVELAEQNLLFSPITHEQ